MYQDVRSYNSSRSQRNKPDVLFINVIDGGGWLARPNYNLKPRDNLHSITPLAKFSPRTKITLRGEYLIIHYTC